MALTVGTALGLPLKTILVPKMRFKGYLHHCDTCECEVWEEVKDKHGKVVMEERQSIGNAVIYDMNEAILSLGRQDDPESFTDLLRG